MNESLRQTGRTTEQMKTAPKGAIYVWCNNRLHYPHALAHHLGRSDLIIISAARFRYMSDINGIRSGYPVVRDHASLSPVSTEHP